MPDLNKGKGKTYLAKGKKITRLVYFCILFAVCFIIVAIFNTPWVTNALGCLVVGVGIGEINGISILSLLSRDRNENDE